MSNETLYLKADRNIETKNEDVRLSDIAKMTCTDKTIVNRLKTIRICKFRKGENRKIVSILKIIEQIQEIYPNVTVSNEGEAEILIEYITEKRKPDICLIFKITFVSLICFFGTAFTIMAFHNDVDIVGIFGNIYTMVTGEYTTGFTVLVVSYSIGLALGIIVFFNHIGSRRITVDPTPVEVEIKKYEDDVNNTLVDTGSREGKIIDVE